jgi:hypothetical protein
MCCRCLRVDHESEAGPETGLAGKKHLGPETGLAGKKHLGRQEMALVRRRVWRTTKSVNTLMTLGIPSRTQSVQAPGSVANDWNA